MLLGHVLHPIYPCYACSTLDINLGASPTERGREGHVPSLKQLLREVRGEDHRGKKQLFCDRYQSST